jgi:hypothetical protein
MSGFTIEPMIIVLALAAVVIGISFYHAHRKPDFNFNAFDLIMTDGSIDRVALAFMLVLAVTTWIMLDLQIKGKMTEGYLTSYGAMWVVPLVAKVVFNKTELPTPTPLVAQNPAPPAPTDTPPQGS